MSAGTKEGRRHLQELLAKGISLSLVPAGADTQRNFRAISEVDRLASRLARSIIAVNNLLAAAYLAHLLLSGKIEEISDYEVAPDLGGRDRDTLLDQRRRAMELQDQLDDLNLSPHPMG